MQTSKIKIVFRIQLTIFLREYGRTTETCSSISSKITLRYKNPHHLVKRGTDCLQIDPNFHSDIEISPAVAVYQIRLLLSQVIYAPHRL
jgi:hypothetical protein